MISTLKQLSANAIGGVLTLDLLSTTLPTEPITTGEDLKKFAIATAGSVLVQIITTLIKHGKEKVRQRRARRASRSSQ